MLRPRPAARLHERADLLLRVHVLRGLRRERAAQRLPELRRRLRAAADPAGDRMAGRTLRREAAAVGETPLVVVQPRGNVGVERSAQGHPARAALTSYAAASASARK